MYSDILKQADLDPDEVIIYEYLLEHGECSAGTIIKETPLKRGNVYNKLADLVKKGLVEQYDKGKIAHFRVEHPRHLLSYVEQRQKSLEKAKKTIDVNLESLISDYNLTNNKPGVYFFEGKEQIIKMYQEFLKEAEKDNEILSIEEKGEMIKFLGSYCDSYVKTRIGKQIKNKSIAPDINTLNFTDSKQLIETRLLKTEDFPFTMDVKFSGQKTMLVTFSGKEAVGILIDNKEITNNFKVLFNFIWKTLDDCGLGDKRVKSN